MTRPTPARGSWVERLRRASAVWLVDRAGAIREMTPEAYAALTGADLRGTTVHLTLDEAQRAKARRKRAS